MASIVLASVGQAIGAATGVPFAAQIGSMIGSSIGGSLGGKNKSHYEGARLENLAVQTSAYGRMIPIVFWTVRISGNVIWARPIRELETTTRVGSSGGKGGAGKRTSSSTSTTYSYYSTLAIAICEGEITRIDRVCGRSIRSKIIRCALIEAHMAASQCGYRLHGSGASSRFWQHASYARFKHRASVGVGRPR